MLIKLGIILILVLSTFIFLGIKISESIKQKEIKILFFCLYGMSIFTLFNFAISIYFFIALQHKKGPIGPRGKKGEIGDNGTHGICDHTSCLQKSLQNMIVNRYENDLDFFLNGPQRIAICSFGKKLLNKTILNTPKGKQFGGTAILELKKIIDTQVTKENNPSTMEINAFKDILASISSEIQQIEFLQEFNLPQVTSAEIKHDLCQ